MDLGLKGKNVIVTAGTKGIGKAMVEGFLNEGARVITCSRDEKNLESVRKEYHITALKCDLSARESTEKFANEVFKEFPNVDVLVLNSGGPRAGFLFDIEDDDWYRAFEMNFMNFVRLSKLFLKGMIEKRWGRIIFMTSMTVKFPIDNLYTSNAIRSGLVGLVKTMAREFAPFNITVNSVAPGWTLTRRVDELLDEGKKKEIISKIPMGRMADPKEIANLVVFLASEKASYITGQIVLVDGGYSNCI
ncbi:MAG: SDR family oxidoreductase [Thermotogae bacterium]|nr:SDR family oxidoreductase [Thermotogota bacterium]